MTRSAVALLVLALSAGCTKPAPLGDYDSGVFIPDAYTLPDVGPRPDTGLADAGMDAGTRTTTYTWYRDIQPIVYAACIRCHQDPPLFGAPVPRLSAMQDDRSKVPFLANLEARLTARFMPGVTARGFVGLNYDSDVPGIEAPQSLAFAATGIPARIKFDPTTSYYAGAGLNISFGP